MGSQRDFHCIDTTQILQTGAGGGFLNEAWFVNSGVALKKSLKSLISVFKIDMVHIRTKNILESDIERG